MRDYAKIAPQFWIGQTGRELKAAGPEAVIVAIYLMTSPHANMIGLYYLPKLYIAHETGLGFEGASKGLVSAIEAGFCTYDEASEHVFVHEMARYQIGDRLKPDDKRCKGVENELEKVPKCALELAFRASYSDAFNLKKASPSEAPSKPRAGAGARTGARTGGGASRSPSGSRLHDDWEPTADMLDWAKSERPDIDAVKETENFRDHWLAKSGKDATKLDWERTWRKWIRSAYARPKLRSVGASTGYQPLPGEI